jgi:glucose/arabinose dehydrogenase
MGASIVLASLSACSDLAKLPAAAGYGYAPNLPSPSQSIIHTVNIALAKGWRVGDKPTSAPGTRVAAFAAGLEHPRWLYVLPNGDVLVTKANAPTKTQTTKGIRAWVMGIVMKFAGAGLASPNRIILLRDTDCDGVADFQSVLLDGLNSSFGIVQVGNELYVANTDAVLCFPYSIDDTQIKVAGRKLLDLPAGPINHHWTKNINASPDASKLFVIIGSNGNVAESGMEVKFERAAIWEVDIKSGEHRVFASGLRNPNGLA